MISTITYFVDEWHGGYTKVGCFNDKPYKFSDQYSTDAIRGKRQYYDSKSVIEDCYNRALSKRNTHFAIKRNHICYTTSFAHETYDKYGPGTGCVAGRGGDDAITVYKLLPGRLYTKKL